MITIPFVNKETFSGACRCAAKGVIVSAAGLLFCAGGLRAEVPRIEARADPKEIFIGDIIHYNVTLTLPAGAQVKWDDKALQQGGVTVKDFRQEKKQDRRGNEIVTLRFQLTTYETGTLTIPEYAADYLPAGAGQWQTLRAPPLTVTVHSAIDDPRRAQLRPLKARVRVRPPLFLWLMAALGAAALIAAVIFLRKRRREKTRLTPPKPAHVLAYEELERLRAAALPAQGLFAEYFARLSGCVRRYLENRFHLRAPLMSTEEFLAAAKTSPALSGEQKQSLKDFLELADLVKFARYSSSLTEADNALAAAKNFIEQTKEPEPVQTEKAR